MCQKIQVPEEYINNKCQSYFEEIIIDDINTLEKILSLFSDEWIFRGQEDSSWRLEPSIERNTCNAGDDDLDRIIIDGKYKERISKEIKGVNLPTSNLGWLAFTQHHGGWTKLLDFTRDPYIALFFAFALHKKGSPVCSKACTVWAINKKWCLKNTYSKLKMKKQFQNLTEENMKTSEFFDKAFIYLSDFEFCICPFVSDWKNERMVKQKSIFLCKCDPSDVFETNLEESDCDNTNIYVKKIILPISLEKETVTLLNKKGLTREILLPGEEIFLEMQKDVLEFERLASEELKRIRKKGIDGQIL